MIDTEDPYIDLTREEFEREMAEVEKITLEHLR